MEINHVQRFVLQKGFIHFVTIVLLGNFVVLSFEHHYCLKKNVVNYVRNRIEPNISRWQPEAMVSIIELNNTRSFCAQH